MRLEAQEDVRLLQRTEKPTILVVDDEAIIRDLCSRALKDFRVLQAENGREALRIYSRETVDLILVDVMMPIMNGLDLLQQVKERDPEQLVIVMTGYADKDIILRALKADADDFINKPINLLQLKTSIQNALEKKTLHRALVQLKQMDRLKSDFLGLISHKLRTPTTSISLFIQNLATGNIDTSSPEFLSAVTAIREESDYLAYLIQDLLYFSDIILEDGEGHTSLENLKEVATSVIAEKRTAAEHKGHTLSVDFQGDWNEVLIDRLRLSFALNALLDNAIKFTPPGGEINVTGRATLEELRITVADNGPGMAAEEVSKVFEKFYQVDPQNTGQVRGFGLGLFYARQFVQEHGGSLHLASTSGQGTEAIISLPRMLLEPGD